MQEIYEGKSKGMLVNHFIKASKNDNPSSVVETTDEYLAAVVNNFFKNVDFESKELYHSSFLIDKVTDYVFLLNTAEGQEQQQKLYKKSISKVMEKVSGDKTVKKDISEFLITRFTNSRNSEIVDWLFADYYNTLPESLQDAEFKKDKVALLQATVGRTAPDFSWKEGESAYKLSTLSDSDTYLLVFWSTGCSHCLEEIPLLHKYMKKHNNTSVIAFGIEQEAPEWVEYVKQLDGWHNVMGTHPDNKWDNETVQTYQLVGTPTYFVLNSNKQIVAMPNSFDDVKTYFENPNKVAKN